MGQFKSNCCCIMTFFGYKFMQIPCDLGGRTLQAMASVTAVKTSAKCFSNLPSILFPTALLDCERLRVLYPNLMQEHIARAKLSSGMLAYYMQ